MPDVSQHRVVSPNGEMFIYADVPFDSEYTHSINRYASGNSDLFSVIGNQVGTGYCKYRLFYQSYTRLSDNSVRVQIPKENLIHCNYIAIRNGTGFEDQIENKTFFAFIERVEYVNNETSDIFFKLDYLQTYWGNFTIPANFIEREHCAISDDTVRNNLVPESIANGDMIVQKTDHYTYPLFNSYIQSQQIPWHIVIAYVPNWDGSSTKYVKWETAIPTTVQQRIAPTEQTLPQKRNGFLSPVCFISQAVVASDIVSMIGNIQRVVNELTDDSAQIIDMFMIPSEVYNDNFNADGIVSVHPFSVSRPTSFKYMSKTGSYTPHNKKLFHSPYSKVVVTNNNGGNTEYNWEMFTSGETNASFGVLSAMNPNPVLHIYPAQYRNINADFENSLTYDDFPKISWNEDSFSKWWAQNKTNFGLSLATGAISTGLMVATGGASGLARAGQLAEEGMGHMQAMENSNLLAGQTAGLPFRERAKDYFQAEDIARKSAWGRMGFSAGMGAQRIAQTLGQLPHAQATPDSAKVQSNIPVVNGLQNRIGFVAYSMGVSGEIAEIIDKYFDMYGYQTDKVKVPNFITGTNRPIWDYIKMQNCLIKAQTGYRGIPEEAQTIIQGVFNKGITLWQNVSQIGDYNLDNHTQNT